MSEKSYSNLKQILIAERNGSLLPCLIFVFFFQLSDVLNAQQEWQIERIYAIIALTAAVAPLIIHQIWDSIGSKRFILMANFLTIIAWILVMFNGYNICLL